MDLLSPAVRWLAVGCALLALVAGTAATSWVLRRRWLNIAKNAVAVGLSAALVVLGLGLELNRQNAWYPRLGDVFASSETAPDVTTEGAPPDVTFAGAQPSRTDQRELPALPAPGQRVQNFTVPTSTGHRQWPVQVILPQDYFQPGAAHRAYPVLYLAHGVPGGIAVWSSRVSATGMVDPLVAQKKIAPPILVIPALAPNGIDSECVVGPDSTSQMETWLAKDVPAFVQAHLRAMPEREGWAVAGYSAGGWCASLLPMLHPERFAAGISLGGYFEPWWNQQNTPTWSKNSPQATRLDLVKVAETRKPPVALYVQTSRDDKESWPSTHRFLAKVKAPTVVKAEINPRGGHSFDMWIPAFTRGFTWLGATVPGFRPA